MLLFLFPPMPPTEFFPQPPDNSHAVELVLSKNYPTVPLLINTRTLNSNNGLQCLMWLAHGYFPNCLSSSSPCSLYTKYTGSVAIPPTSKAHTRHRACALMKICMACSLTSFMAALICLIIREAFLDHHLLCFIFLHSACLLWHIHLFMICVLPLGGKHPTSWDFVLPRPRAVEFVE